MKTILITGGQGFIGTHLAIKLFEQGYNIICADKSLPDDNQILMDYKNTKNENIRKELDKRFTLMVIDLTDKELYKEVYLEHFKDVDLIYHLASPIGVHNIVKNSGSTLRKATKINQFIDEICELYNIPIVYSSSSEVHGPGEVNSDSHFNIKKFSDSPRWSYAAAKTHGEFLFHSGSYPSSVIRFFNIVGIGQKTSGMVVPTFIQAALNNENLTILENGIRSYCDIREALNYIIPIGLDLMENGLISKYNQGDFNIGNSNNIISAEQLAEKIIDLTHSESIIIHDQDMLNCNVFPIRTLVQDNELLLDMEIEHIELDDIILNILNTTEGDE